jgi:hypothetical protein
MWTRIIQWMETTNGFAIGAVLDVALAVALAAIATASLRLLFELL